MIWRSESPARLFAVALALTHALALNRTLTPSVTQARLALEIVRHLLSAYSERLSASSIGIISPYNGQVRVTLSLTLTLSRPPSPHPRRHPHPRLAVRVAGALHTQPLQRVART